MSVLDVRLAGVVLPVFPVAVTCIAVSIGVEVLCPLTSATMNVPPIPLLKFAVKVCPEPPVPPLIYHARPTVPHVGIADKVAIEVAVPVLFVVMDEKLAVSEQVRTNKFPDAAVVIAPVVRDVTPLPLIFTD